MEGNYFIHKKAQLQGHKASIFALAEGPDEHSFFSGDGEGWIVKWSESSFSMGKLFATIDGNVFALYMIKSENILVAGNMYGGVYWISLDTGKVLHKVKAHDKGIFKFEMLGRNLMSLGGDGRIVFWDCSNFEILESLKLSDKSLRTCKLLPDNEFVVGASDGHLYFLNQKNKAINQVLRNAHNSSVFSSAFDSRNNLLITGGKDAQINVWQRINKVWSLNKNVAAHLFAVNALYLCDKRKLLISGSRDKTIKVWSIDDYQLLKVYNAGRGGHVNSVNKLLSFADETHMISASDDRSLIVWQLEQ